MYRASCLLLRNQFRPFNPIIFTGQVQLSILDLGNMTHIQFGKSSNLVSYKPFLLQISAGVSRANLSKQESDTGIITQRITVVSLYETSSGDPPDRPDKPDPIIIIRNGFNLFNQSNTY